MDNNDDESLDPQWLLPDDEKSLSNDEIVSSEDEFEDGCPDSEKKIFCSVPV